MLVIKMYIENGNQPYNIVEHDDLLGYSIVSENIDAEVADMIIQYCCFGQIIYAQEVIKMWLLCVAAGCFAVSLGLVIYLKMKWK